MKKIIFSCVIFCLVLSLIPVTVGCGVAQATFNASANSGAALLRVEFTNATQTSLFKKADEYRWDFGDGATMTTTTAEQTVSHDYTKAGTFTVTLTAVKSGNTPKTSIMTLSISVTHGPLDRVQIIPQKVELNIGESQKFTTLVEDVYGNPVAEAKLIWEVAAGVGSIDQNGELEAGTKAGTYDEGVGVTAELNNKTAKNSTSVQVKPDPLDAVTISPIVVPAGETQHIEAVAIDQYGNALDDVEITWTVLNTNAGSIVSGSSLKAGEVADEFADAIEVQVQQGDITRTATAPVTISPGALYNMYIAPDPADIGIGMTQQFAAAGADRYGNRVSGLNINWSVVNGGGSINNNGLFTAGTVPGNYGNTVMAEASQAGATRSTTVDVTVEQDHIAFMSDRDNEDQVFDMYIMDINGNNQERITTSHVDTNFPAPSPNGRRIAVAYDSPDGGIFMINDDGTWEFAITSGIVAFEPAWSPDGKKIAFCKQINDWSYNIYVMDVDGGDLTRLTTNTIYSDETPSWSPDSTRIVFESDRDGNTEIYVMNADGSNLQRLTNNTVWDANPKWSPNGQKIIYQSAVGTRWALFTMNIDGSNRTQVTNVNYSCNYPSWSPDGTKIVFHSWQDNNQAEISIANADGSSITHITNNSALDYDPIWLPRKMGVEVSESTIIIPPTGRYQTMSTQDITAMASAAVVRIETDLGNGSGFIIDPSGLILTNNHVIKDADTITVRLESGKEYSAIVKGRDLMRDMALLKITATGLPYLEIADSCGISTGQQVVVMGFPLGSVRMVVTSGIISTIDFDRGENVIWIQTDSAINSGNSGGPMLDLRGRVVGIVTAKLFGIGVEGVGWAISFATVNLYLPRLQAGETIYN